MHTMFMRTTVDLSPDVEKAIDERRRTTGAGLSQTVNELLRQGIAATKRPTTKFTQRTHPIGLRIDVSNVQDALDALDD